MKMILIQIPAKIPISSGKTKQATNAAMPGIKSVSMWGEKNRKSERQNKSINSKNIFRFGGSKITYFCYATLV